MTKLTEQQRAYMFEHWPAVCEIPWNRVDINGPLAKKLKDMKDKARAATKPAKTIAKSTKTIAKKENHKSPCTTTMTTQVLLLQELPAVLTEPMYYLSRLQRGKVLKIPGLAGYADELPGCRGGCRIASWRRRWDTERTRSRRPRSS